MCKWLSPCHTLPPLNIAVALIASQKATAYQVNYQVSTNWMILKTSWLKFNFKTDFLFLVLHYYNLTLKFQTKKAIMPVRLVVTRFVFLTANVLRCWFPCYRPHRKQVRGFLIAPKLFPCRKSKIMVMKFSTPFKKWQMVGSACRIVVNATSLKCHSRCYVCSKWQDTRKLTPFLPSLPK